MIDGEHREPAARTVHELLAEQTQVICSMDPGEGFDERIDAFDPFSTSLTEIRIINRWFYGDQGAPQCTVITREYDDPGYSLERLMTWYQGDQRSDFKPTGSFKEAIIPNESNERIEDIKGVDAVDITPEHVRMIAPVLRLFKQRKDERAIESRNQQEIRRKKESLGHLALHVLDVYRLRRELEAAHAQLQQALQDHNEANELLANMSDNEVRTLLLRTAINLGERIPDLNHPGGVVPFVRSVIRQGRLDTEP